MAFSLTYLPSLVPFYRIDGNELGDLGVRLVLNALRSCTSLERVKLLPNARVHSRALLARARAVQHRVSGRVILQRVQQNDPSITEIDWSHHGVSIWHTLFLPVLTELGFRWLLRLFLIDILPWCCENQYIHQPSMSPIVCRWMMTLRARLRVPCADLSTSSRST